MLHEKAIEPLALELLKALQADSMFSDFHLAGGTGLALQLGHRFSNDLDLISSRLFDQEAYIGYLETNYNFRLDHRAINSLKGSIGEVKVDFITHGFLLVKPIIFIDNTRLYSIEDIGAMKINAITGNGTMSKDFVDLYFLLKKYSMSDLLGFYEKKYANRDVFHVIKSLNYFDEVVMDDWPEILIEKETDWEKMKKVINNQCSEYFRKFNLE
jgi:predicted nucleotidyltransferase component of viral defense system